MSNRSSYMNNTAQKTKFCMIDTNFVTFTEEIFNGKLHFLCSISLQPQLFSGQITFNQCQKVYDTSLYEVVGGDESLKCRSQSYPFDASDCTRIRQKFDAYIKKHAPLLLMTLFFPDTYCLGHWSEENENIKHQIEQLIIFLQSLLTIRGTLMQI